MPGIDVSNNDDVTTLKDSLREGSRKESDLLLQALKELHSDFLSSLSKEYDAYYEKLECVLGQAPVSALKCYFRPTVFKMFDKSPPLCQYCGSRSNTDTACLHGKHMCVRYKSGNLSEHLISAENAFKSYRKSVCVQIYAQRMFGMRKGVEFLSFGRAGEADVHIWQSSVTPRPQSHTFKLKKHEEIALGFSKETEQVFLRLMVNFIARKLLTHYGDGEFDVAEFIDVNITWILARPHYSLYNDFAIGIRDTLAPFHKYRSVSCDARSDVWRKGEVDADIAEGKKRLVELIAEWGRFMREGKYFALDDAHEESIKARIKKCSEKYAFYI